MTTLLRRFFPQTLLGRIFLLISLLIFASGMAWFALSTFAEREPRALRLAQLTVNVVNLTSAAIVAADPAKRLDLLRELAESEGVHLYPKEETDIVTPLPETYFFKVMKGACIDQLGPKTSFASNINGREGLGVSFSIDASDNSGDDDYWIMLPRGRAEDRIPWYWFGCSGVSLLLALLAAWLIVSHITRPLRALAASARELGQGRYPEPVAETGASELVQLSKTFNRMSYDLQQNAAERTEVLAGISHDLRTPLARLRLECEMSISDDDAREAVIADIEQMNTMISQFLDYARGDGDESPIACDINAMVTQIVERLARTDTLLHIDLGKIPTSVNARPKALTRAISNLLDNARKYGGFPITVQTRCDGNNIIIDILDCGSGLPEKELERLKRPFTRLEGARTDANGTGLGLAIVERVARMHAGKFDLSNRPEGGLAARLRLPIC